jgi:RimJ/RimL family protein N-acetyltransferase
VQALLTERLQLRALRESDADELFRLYSDPSVASTSVATRADVEQEPPLRHRPRARRAGRCGPFTSAPAEPSWAPRLRPLEMRGPEVGPATTFTPA